MVVYKDVEMDDLISTELSEEARTLSENVQLYCCIRLNHMKLAFDIFKTMNRKTLGLLWNITNKDTKILNSYSLVIHFFVHYLTHCL